MCWEFKRAAEICDENVGPERMFELWVPPQAALLARVSCAARLRREARWWFRGDSDARLASASSRGLKIKGAKLDPFFDGFRTHSEASKSAIRSSRCLMLIHM